MTYLLPSDVFETCSGGVFYCIAEWANNTTDGLFFPAMLFAFVAVLFLATQRFGTPRAFGFASVFALFGAVWLATMQLMAWWIATLFILSGFIGFAVMLISER